MRAHVARPSSILLFLYADWSVFADVCKAEAEDLYVTTRALSLPQIIDLLVIGSISCPAISSHVPQDPQ